MMLKDLLLYVSPEDVSAAHAATRHAIKLARTYEAHLTAMILEVEIEAPVSLYRGGALLDLDPLRDSRHATAQQEAENFSGEAERAGIRFAVLQARSYAGDAGEVVAARARLHDLTILPAPGREPQDGLTIVEDCLFSSGRPVLLVPEPGAATPTDEVVIAWDGSAPAVRAMHDALPFLPGARRVTVITIGEEKTAPVDGSGHDLCAHLGRHGIEAGFRYFDSRGRATGEAIAEVARELGADLIVMGGFAHSRLRDFVLGGATRHILNATPMPVLLSH
ncbi:MAG: putative UspA stress protein [Microvirga sp.]|jgi:nucleotide-binding universal stress UspA family protein|nr:putative UspA stress protein [Microvirga sp.]